MQGAIESIGNDSVFSYEMCIRDREREPLLHQSMAASLGIYDIQKGCFDTEAVERAGMDIEMLPRVTKENALCGRTKEGVPVAVSLGDNQASFLGSVNEECKVLLNVGTGAQLSAYSEKIAEGENLECRPYVGDSVSYTHLDVYKRQAE